GMGVRMSEIRVVADVEAAIVEAVNTLRARNDYVFTTGGIGPTHDDITTACVAKAFGVAVIRHPEADRRLRAHYGLENINEARMSMADIPETAELIDNPVSVAPGFRLGNVHVLAGVPPIMQAMFDGIAHTIVGGAPILSLSLAAHLREGDLAQALGEIQAKFKTVDIGSYPFGRGGRIGVSVVLRSADEAALTAAGEAVKTLMRSLGEEPEIGSD
ncbi:MAG: competence/damage-inducible protein A, partial [Rhodospirillaceae bacterium]